MCVCTCRPLPAMMHMGKPGDSLQGLVLASVLGAELRPSGLAASTLTHELTNWASAKLYIQCINIILPYLIGKSD